MSDRQTNGAWDGPGGDLFPPDPQVTAMLRAVVGEVPFDAVDWESMQRCIVGDAAGLLARRQRRPWLSWMAQWSPVALPGGAVVAVAALVMLAVTPSPQRETTTSATPTFVSAIDGSASAQTLADGITGTFEGDTLLTRILHD